MLGGIPGGQAAFLRILFADVGPIKIESGLIESGLEDEQVVFLSDIFPTGYMALENCQMEKGDTDTVAVCGFGTVAQFAIKSTWMRGAGRVIAIDCVAERVSMAATNGPAYPIHFEKEQVYERLMKMTSGRGPDRCIDAVGCEAHASSSLTAIMDMAKEQVSLQGDRTYVLGEAIKSCRKDGTI